MQKANPEELELLLFFSLIWMPVLWISTLVITGILVFKWRKKLFGGSQTKWTIAILLFCTPIPLYIVFLFLYPTPEVLRSGSSYIPKNGKVYKTENWYYPSNQQKYVDMYFVADSLENEINGENAFKKDSTWIYFTKTGDTLKIEKYEEGELIFSQ